MIEMGRTEDVNPWLIGKRGWLKRKERRDRRDRPNALTDDQVLELISRIDAMENYTKLEAKFDRLMRERNKGLIAFSWIYFKRRAELVRVQLRDVSFDEQTLVVTFYVQKKVRRIKVCPMCKEKNSKKAQFCNICGVNISRVRVKTKGERSIVVNKRKSMESEFCQLFVKWIKILRIMGLPKTAYIFPPFKTFEGYDFDFNEHINCARLGRIIQDLDESLFSAIFRYGASEKYLLLGYTREELKDIGDWSDVRMPSVYAKRAGLSPGEERWSKDKR